MTHEHERTNDPVGFFTVAKLIGILVPTISALLLVHTFVMKGIMTNVVDEKMQQFAVAKIEYEVRRSEMERAFANMGMTDLKQSQQIEALQNQLNQIQRDLQLIRERQDQVRVKLGIKNGT